MLGQIEGATEVIQTAARHSWEAVIVATVLLAALVSLSWLVRAWMSQAGDREARMGERITRLEEQIHNSLMALVREGTEALRLTAQSTTELREVVKELHDALLQRPCLLDGDEVLDKLRKNHGQ